MHSLPICIRNKLELSGAESKRIECVLAIKIQLGKAGSCDV